MIRPKPSRLHLVDQFFMGASPVHETVTRLSKVLREMHVPFAISGALAVNHHGHLRATGDVDVLLREDDLASFKEQHLGPGWVDKFPGSTGFRDTVTNTPVDVLISGRYPGDATPKPIQFPDPADAYDLDEAGVPYLPLSNLIELKLASGMTAIDRPRDLDDVIQLIRVNHLPKSFGSQLSSYVQVFWDRYWEAAQHRDEF